MSSTPNAAMSTGMTRRGGRRRRVSDDSSEQRSVRARISPASEDDDDDDDDEVVVGLVVQAQPVLASTASSIISGSTCHHLPLARAVPAGPGTMAAAAVQIVPDPTSAGTATVPPSAIAKLLVEEMMKSNGIEVEHALKELYNHIGTANPNWQHNAREASSLGAPAILIGVMKKFHLVEPIQYYGCLCVVLVAYKNVETKITISKLGGVESIVNAMVAFPNSKRLQFQACQALQNSISETAPDAIKNVTESFVNDLGGVIVVLEAMKRYPDYAALQLRGMTVFLNLAFQNHFKQKMLQAGVVTVVGSVLEKHSDNEELKSTAKSVLNKVLS